MSFAITNSLATGCASAGAFLKRVGDIAVNLRVTEKILTEVERRLFSPDQTLFDIEFVRANLQKLRSLPPETPSDEFLQIEFALDQEFNLWRSLLEERDRRIETYHLRRFFDTANQSFDQAVFIALAYFYRSSQFYTSNLSKFDLVVTRLLSSGSRQSREIKHGRDDRAERLRDMFAAWDGDDRSQSPLTVRTEAIARLDEFIFEAEMLSDFEELIRSNIFDRVRAFKRELGGVFFEHDVVAASAECNLVLGNVFNELLTRANQNLGEKLSASFDFAGAFQDASPNSRVHISEILNELRFDEAETGRSHNPDVDHLWNLLGVVCGAKPSDTNQTVAGPAEIAPPTAAERIANLLATLEEPEPDVRMLREYTQHSKSLWTIDLNDFVKADDPQLDRLCRDILRIILITDELCTRDLNQKKDVPKPVFDELSDVFQKSLELGDLLEQLLERYHGSLQNRLLVVSNKFLETRLRLERTIVRYSNHQLGLLPAEPAALPATQEAPSPAPAAISRRPRRVNRWLVLATIIVALFSGGAYFASMQLDELVPSASDFEELSVADLPAGEHFERTFRLKGTLFVIAKQSFENLPDDEKRSVLKKMASIPSPTKIDTVIATNPDGRPVGDLSKNGITVQPEL